MCAVSTACQPCHQNLVSSRDLTQVVIRNSHTRRLFTCLNKKTKCILSLKKKTAHTHTKSKTSVLVSVSRSPVSHVTLSACISAEFSRSHCGILTLPYMSQNSWLVMFTRSFLHRLCILRCVQHTSDISV